MKDFKVLIFLGLLFGFVVLVSFVVEAETSKDEKKVDEAKGGNTVDDTKTFGWGHRYWHGYGHGHEHDHAWIQTLARVSSSSYR
ncbi:hypothetical protein ACFX12_045850 [Malus domestica]